MKVKILLILFVFFALDGYNQVPITINGKKNPDLEIILREKFKTHQCDTVQKMILGMNRHNKFRLKYNQIDTVIICYRAFYYNNQSHPYDSTCRFIDYVYIDTCKIDNMTIIKDKKIYFLINEGSRGAYVSSIYKKVFIFRKKDSAYYKYIYGFKPELLFVFDFREWFFVLFLKNDSIYVIDSIKNNTSILADEFINRNYNLYNSLMNSKTSK